MRSRAHSPRPIRLRVRSYERTRRSWCFSTWARSIGRRRSRSPASPGRSRTTSAPEERKPTEAAAAARDAWASPDLSIDDQNRIGARFWSSLTAADHDRRIDALLFAKKPADAQRALANASPARRAAFSARIAMQTSATNADQLYRAVESQVPSDAGLLMDRLRFLKDTYRNVSGARWLAARPHNFTYRPADPERFYQMLLILARDAWSDRNYAQAYDIARQVDDSLPAGADVSLQPYGVRDEYTSLTWTAGEAAMSGLNRYADAARMFHKYAQGGRSLQVTSRATIGPAGH